MSKTRLLQLSGLAGVVSGGLLILLDVAFFVFFGDQPERLVGIGNVRSGIVSFAIGWITIAWTVLWLVARFTVGAGAPAIPVIMPAVIGIALLVKSKSNN